MNNYCFILFKVRKRRLNWREWKNMTVQASARDPGLRSPGRQNLGKMLILAYTWIILWYVAPIEPLTSFAFKLAYQNEKKRNIWYISIHINTYQYTYQYISCIPEKYRKKAVLARSLRHKSLGTLLRNPNEWGQHHRLQKENVPNHSRTTQSPGQKDHCLHYWNILLKDLDCWADPRWNLRYPDTLRQDVLGFFTVLALSLAALGIWKHMKHFLEKCLLDLFGNRTVRADFWYSAGCRSMQHCQAFNSARWHDIPEGIGELF